MASAFEFVDEFAHGEFEGDVHVAEDLVVEFVFAGFEQGGTGGEGFALDVDRELFGALEKADLERRRLMTDEQRISEDKRLGKNSNDIHNDVLHIRIIPIFYVFVFALVFFRCR